MIPFQWRVRTGDTRVPDGAASTSWVARTLITTMRWAGRTRWTRPTNGPSRLPRIGAAHATGRSCTGRRASRQRMKFAPSFTTSSTSRRPSLRLRDFRSRIFVNGVQQHPIEGVSMVYSFNDGNARRSARDPILRDVRQSRHLPQGLDRGNAAQYAMALQTRQSRHSTTITGSSTTPAKTGAR